MPTPSNQTVAPGTLGPGPLLSSGSSPFAIPADQWQSINRFVVGVNATSNDTATQFAGLIPSFPELKTAAAAWTTRIAPGILAVANGINQHGQVTVPPAYTALRTLLAKWQTTPAQPDEKTRFTTLLQGVQDSATANAKLAQAIVPDLQALVTAIEEVNQEAQNALGAAFSGAVAPGQGQDVSAQITAAISQIAGQLSQLAALLSVLEHPPVQAIELIEGGWNAIASDLDHLRQWVLTQVDAGLPVLDALGLESAIAEWQNVAEEARCFSQSMSQ